MVFLNPGESNLISLRYIHGLKVIHQKKARLDFFLVSCELMILIDKVKIGPGYRSNYAMIELYITYTKFERGKGFWKFNNSLLNDCVYVDKIKDTIRKCCFPI